jgi:hypothetical protein
MKTNSNIVTIVKSTNAFQSSNNQMFLSASVLPIFENAVRLLNAGFSYEEWEEMTTCGITAKKIVKEIFEA